MSIYLFKLTAGSKTAKLSIDIGWTSSSWSSDQNFFQAHTGGVAMKTGAIGLEGMAGRVGELRNIPKEGLDSLSIGGSGTLKVLLQPTSGDYTQPDGTWMLTGTQ